MLPLSLVKGFKTLVDGFLFPLLFFKASVNLLNKENFVFVQPVVDREFARLAKGLVAPRVLALVGLVSCVHVQVVLQILGQGEALPTELASEPSARIMGRYVSSQAVLVGVLFGTGHERARKRSG